MNRRVAIIGLAVVFYALQLVLLYNWYVLGGANNAFDMVLAAVFAMILAGIDVGAVNYLLQTIHRSEQLYAAAVGEELERALESYRIQAEREADHARMIGETVSDELLRTRNALALGQLDEADEHLKRSLDVASTTRSAYCENVAVAAVLEVKERQCAEAGVGFSARASVPDNLPLPEVEVAALLFNLVDNALHECERLTTEGQTEAPEIAVRVKTQAGQLFFEVSNPCKPDAIARTGASISRRADTRREHGWGTQIVDGIAESYGGIVSRAVADGVFTTSVMIPLLRKGDRTN